MNIRFTLFITVLSLSLPIMTHQTMKHGILCSVEGIEGCGKSTFIKKLHKKLTEEKIKSITTKEPGKTDLGQKIRSILMNRTAQTCTIAEFLLFAADRSQHFSEFIIPHLENQYVIISDRMHVSSMVYQGYVKGLNKSMIAYVNDWAMHNIKPDIIFYLKLDPAIAAQRIAQRNQTEASPEFEKEMLPQQQALSDGFDQALSYEKNVITLDATRTSEQLVEQAYQIIIEKIIQQ